MMMPIQIVAKWMMKAVHNENNMDIFYVRIDFYTRFT